MLDLMKMKIQRKIIEKLKAGAETQAEAVCYDCGAKIKGNIIYKCACDEKCPIIFCKECVEKNQALVVLVDSKKYKALRKLDFFNLNVEV